MEMFPGEILTMTGTLTFSRVGRPLAVTCNFGSIRTTGTGLLIQCKPRSETVLISPVEECTGDGGAFMTV